MAAAARPDSEPGDSLRGLRVLIIEDEALIAMVYEDLLAEQGCESLGPAASVAQALALIAADPPDAALLDVNLDGEISGPVAERLHQEGIPFLVVTGYEDLGLGVPAMEAAPRLCKPIVPETLIEAMRTTFR